MKIGIIGAGYVGLSAAYSLSKKGHKVHIFEALDRPGGLATSFKDTKWKWSLEDHYHHWFSNDNHIKRLAKEIGHKIIFARPITSVLVDDKIYQLDSPLSLLRFPHLSLIDRVRTGVVLFYLKIIRNWRFLERVSTKEFLVKTMGKNSWKTLWEPLMKGKFGEDVENVAASWFWARIKKRSASLGYPEGGFGAFAEKIAGAITEKGGEIKYKSRVTKVERDGDKVRLTVDDKQLLFDKVICTLPTVQMTKITRGLPKKYLDSLKVFKGVGAVTVILALNDSFFHDGTYWLNVSQKGYPFLAVVEHTHLVNKGHYEGEHLLYVGNYLPSDHPYFKKDVKKLIDEFTPYLKKINPRFDKKMIRKAWVARSPFAQPVVFTNYSKDIPSHTTPFGNYYLANIQQVYPWDRGTNYAVELGYKVAELVDRKP